MAEETPITGLGFFQVLTKLDVLYFVQFKIRSSLVAWTSLVFSFFLGRFLEGTEAQQCTCILRSSGQESLRRQI